MGGPADPRRGRWTGPAAIGLVLVGVFATGVGLAQMGTGLSWGDIFDRPGKPPPREFPVLEPSRPIRIAIPSLDLRAPVSPVGLAADGSIAAPPLERHHEAGWFDQGPTPGQFGPAIIVGHADTRTGPSVFHGLPRLRPGAVIEVTRRDRTVAVFEVSTVERFTKARLPPERVYGDFSRPSLRLITCGGRYEPGEGYVDNVIVFASLVRTRRA